MNPARRTGDAGGDRVGQWGGDFVTLCGAFDDFPPPLQPDECQGRLAGDFTGAGKLVVEGVKRQQGVPPVWWREQRGQEPIRIVAANQRGNCFVHANGWWRGWQAKARRPTGWSVVRPAAGPVGAPTGWSGGYAHRLVRWVDGLPGWP